MGSAEYAVSKEDLPELPPFFKETVLGYPKGASRQYRYGRLHVREYSDRFVFHCDAASPDDDPIGHLVHDAPEILAFLGGAILGGAAGSAVSRRPAAVLAGAGIGAYMLYRAAKWMR